MEERNFTYILVYGGVDHISNHDAKIILNLTYLELTNVFQNEESNQRLLATFLSSEIIKNVESARLKDASSGLSGEEWAKDFLHLLSRRYDVASALNQLVNLDDAKLDSYKLQIHEIFSLPKFPKTLEVKRYHIKTIDGKFQNQATVPLMENSDSIYNSNERFCKERYYRQDSRESRTNRYKSKKSGVSKASVAIIILAIGCVSLLSVCILSILGYRITKSDNTFLEAVQTPNKKQDVLNSQFISKHSLNNHVLNELYTRGSLNEPTSDLILPHNTTIISSNLINYSNQSRNLIKGNNTFFDEVLNDNPVELEIQIQKMCTIHSNKNISLKIELLNDSYGLKIQCQSEIQNLQILKKPTIKNVYEILDQVPDLKHLEIVYAKQDKIASDNAIGKYTNPTLSSLQTVSILVTNPTYSCHELDRFLGDLSHVKLTKLEIIGMNIENQNKALIGKVIDNMMPHRTLLLKNVSLYSELSIKCNNTSYRQFHVHISNLSTLSTSNNTVIKFLKGASYVEDFMTNIPISNVATKELERLKVQRLDIVDIVNEQTETLTFSHLKKIANLRKFVIHLAGWDPGNMTAPYLVLEGFEELPNGLRDLQVYANFPIVINKKPHCMIYQKSALSFGMVFVSLRLCHPCIPVIGCLSS